MSPRTVPPAHADSSPNAQPLVVRAFGEAPFRTDGPLVCLAFDDAGYLWSLEEPGVVRCWNSRTGRVRFWHYLSELETTWAFGPSARYLVSAGDTVSMWDPRDGRLLGAASSPSWVTALSTSRDGRRIATGHDDGAVRIWDGATLQLQVEAAGAGQPVSALVLSPDGAHLAVAGEDRRITIWDLAARKVHGVLEGHTDRIPALAWHPDGDLLFSAGWDTAVRVWNPRTLEPVILLNTHTRQVTALTLSADGSLLACADAANAVHVWDAEAYRTLAVLRGHATEVACLAFSADGMRLASGGEDGVIQLRRAWEQLGAPAVRPLTTAVSSVPVQVGVSPDGKRLAVTGDEGTLQLWDTSSGDSAPGPNDPGLVHAVAFSPDGKWLVGAGSDTHLRVWEAATGKLFALLDGHHQPASALAFSPDSRFLASGSTLEQRVWIWDLTTAEPFLLIPDAVDGCTIEGVAFHPGGRLLAVGGIDWLATGGSDGAVLLWDIHERCEVATFGGGVTCLAFHPDGKRLVAASLLRSVCIWDIDNHQLLLELTGHDESVSCVACSPDGKWVASGSEDRSVRLWDVDTGECVAVAELGTQVRSLAFSADGRFLFTGNAIGSAFQLDVERLLEQGAD